MGIILDHGNGHFDNQMTLSMPTGSHPNTTDIADIDEDGDGSFRIPESFRSRRR